MLDAMPEPNLPPSWLSREQAERMLTLLDCDHPPLVVGRMLHEFVDHVLEHLEIEQFKAHARKRKPWGSSTGRRRRSSAHSNGSSSG